ncbi:hypothetical protein [Erwinia sp. ErVv1]|uniref:hypothetical protein n=1 Tax=Erwinia sp. ErVv1 TaxID=1603299 RepID=UPI00093A68B7|nr:hypothetical protein [Erwinia sp. ErVv1]
MYVNVQRIVYDPISWIHPQRFSVPEKLASVRCRSILNDIILSEYNLSTGELALSNSTEHYLANHWCLLPRAAFMAICQRHRSSLAWYGNLSKLDNVTRQFALSDITGSKDEFRGRFTFDQLWGMACRELLTFCGPVSKVMKERIPLLFPWVHQENMAPFFPSDDNELLIRMAIQHASRNQ